MTRNILLASIAMLSLFFATIVQAEVYSSISGKVVAEDTKQGVEGVVVLAWKAGGDKDNQFFTMTDATGGYVLKDLSGGNYALGFYKKEKSIYLVELPHTLVDVPKGKNVINMNHILQLGGSISGTVFDSNGKPQTGVSVSAKVLNLQSDWIDNLKTILTDSDGKFLLQGLPESDNCVIKLEVPNHAIMTKMVKIIKGKITENVDFNVKRDDITGISGYVKSTIDNKPIEDAEIVLRDLTGEDIGNAYTDNSGKYSIVGVPPGLYKATFFWPKGGGWIDKENILVETGKSTAVEVEFNKPAPN